MTATRKIQSLAKAIKSRTKRRGHHDVDSSPEAKAALVRFGQGIRVKRAMRPQRVIAGKVGISIKQYSNVERGANWPSLPVYIKLCRVLKIKLPEMLK